MFHWREISDVSLPVTASHREVVLLRNTGVTAIYPIIEFRLNDLALPQ